jgi:hypothetical protein
MAEGARGKVLLRRWAIGARGARVGPDSHWVRFACPSRSAEKRGIAPQSAALRRKALHPLTFMRASTISHA